MDVRPELASLGGVFVMCIAGTAGVISELPPGLGPSLLCFALGAASIGTLWALTERMKR